MPEKAAKPILIKKYNNRKLYDLSRSRYVTLEEIADLIKQGHEVKVIDASTQEDLTNLTLAQILLESERTGKHPLPVDFLHQLIKYGESFREFFQASVASGFDALHLSQKEQELRFKDWMQFGARVAAAWSPPSGSKGTSMESDRATPGGATDKQAATADGGLRSEIEALKERIRVLEGKTQAGS